MQQITYLFLFWYIWMICGKPPAICYDTLIKEITNKLTPSCKGICLKSNTQGGNFVLHFSDVIMSAVAFEITGISIVYSNVCSDTDRRKHQSPASLAFVMRITGDRWIPRTKGQWRGKSFHLMTSLWLQCVKDSLNVPTSMHALWWNRIPQLLWKAYCLSN